MKKQWVWNLRTILQFQKSEISPGLRLLPLAVEHNVVVMTAGSQSRRSRVESYG